MAEHVGVFWDIEGCYRQFGKSVDVVAISEYLDRNWKVESRTAYADWRQHKELGEQLSAKKVQLVQQFPRAVADLKLERCDYIVEALRLNQQLEGAVVVGGDDSYLPIAPPLKRWKVSLIGVGSSSSDNERWRKACDHFSSPTEAGEPPHRKPTHGRQEDDRRIRHYQRVAGQQGLRMPDPVLMWEGINIYANYLDREEEFPDFAALDEATLEDLRAVHPRTSLTEVKKIRQVLFKCYLFRPSNGDTIGFQDSIRTVTDIEERYFDLMLQRIADKLEEPVDYRLLSLAVTGVTDCAERLRQRHAPDGKAVVSPQSN